MKYFFIFIILLIFPFKVYSQDSYCANDPLFGEICSSSQDSCGSSVCSFLNSTSGPFSSVSFHDILDNEVRCLNRNANSTIIGQTGISCGLTCDDGFSFDSNGQCVPDQNENLCTDRIGTTASVPVNINTPINQGCVGGCIAVIDQSSCGGSSVGSEDGFCTGTFSGSQCNDTGTGLEPPSVPEDDTDTSDNSDSTGDTDSETNDDGSTSETTTETNDQKALKMVMRRVSNQPLLVMVLVQHLHHALVIPLVVLNYNRILSLHVVLL